LIKLKAHPFLTVLLKPQKLESSQKQGIYDYDLRIQRTHKLIKSELSKTNQQLIEKYDKVMISESLAKATRHKNLQIVLNLSRYLNKDWTLATKDDIDNVVVRIMQEHSGDSGQETYTTYDHKKILKIFFRWLKLGSRNKEDVQDPPEIKGIKHAILSLGEYRLRSVLLIVLMDSKHRTAQRLCLSLQDIAGMDSQAVQQ
jgi:hypothetical protein